MGNALLEVNNLKKHFPITKGFFQKVTGQIKAVEGISFDIKSGQTLGLVGESGCGKTTTGNLIMNLIKPTNGEIYFKNKNILSMNKKEQKYIYRDLQMIFTQRIKLFMYIFVCFCTTSVFCILRRNRLLSRKS